MRSVFLVFSFLVFFSSVNSAIAQRTPIFRDFPTGGIYVGRHSEPDLSSRDAYAFRTRLREAAREDVNFASHYHVVTWGCGTSCVSGAVVDVISGHVTFFPFSICCSAKIGEADFQPVLVRPNSRLIVFVGLRGEEQPDAAHFYEFTSRGFVYLASSKPFPQPPSEAIPDGRSVPIQEAVPSYRPDISTVRQQPQAAVSAPDPSAQLGPSDLPAMHQTYEMNQARFVRDYEGKSFVGILTLSGVRESIFSKGKYEISFCQTLEGVSCNITDKPTIDLMTDKNKGDQIVVSGIVKDHAFGSVILDACKLQTPR